MRTPSSTPKAFATALDHRRGLIRYRFQTFVLFADEEDGEFAPGSIEMRGATAGSDQTHLVWTDLEEDDHMELIRIDDEARMKSNRTWEPVPVMVVEGLSPAMLFYATWIPWDPLRSAHDMAAVHVGVDHDQRGSCPSLPHLA